MSCSGIRIFYRGYRNFVREYSPTEKIKSDIRESYLTEFLDFTRISKLLRFPLVKERGELFLDYYSDSMKNRIELERKIQNDVLEKRISCLDDADWWKDEGVSD